jgi:GH24 family phage-related lysozyme (muramidase)
MRFRTPEQIMKDLQQIGVGIDQARVLSAAGKGALGPTEPGLRGESARAFAELHKGDVTLTEAQQRALLRFVLPEYETEVRQIIQVPLNQNEFDALVSFDFARGSGNLTEVAKLIQAGDHVGASEFIRHFDDKRGIGLAKRRGAEADLFLRPPSSNKSLEAAQ